MLAVGGMLGSSAAGAQSPLATSSTISFTVADTGVTLSGSANPSAVVLPDGRVRMYVSFSGGLSSFISSDGVQFTHEMDRIEQTAGLTLATTHHFWVVALPNGTYRMYFAQTGNSNGIGSALSTDGLNFTVEPGLRISVAQAEIGPDLTTGGVIRLPNGTYRMYFSSHDFALVGPLTTPNVIKVADSPDGLAWTVKPGVRIGEGSPAIPGNAQHPSALVNPDGSVSVFYGRLNNSPSDTTHGLYVTTSTDGLTFTSTMRLINVGEFGQLSAAIDSAVVRLANGTIVLYHSDRNNTTRVNYVKVKTLTATTSPTPAPAAQKVSVSAAVKGKGRVTGVGISCPGTCKTTLKSGSKFTLRATPASGYRFAGWSGACTGLRACTLRPKVAVKVTAIFRKR